jgi:hypothetical protein
MPNVSQIGVSLLQLWVNTDFTNNFWIQICLLGCTALMMEAVRTPETSVDNHFTRQYIPEDNSEHLTYYLPNILRLLRMVRAMLPAAVLPLLLLSPLADELLDAFLLLVFLFPPVLLDFLLPPERPFGGSCALGPRWWWPEFPLGPGPCTDLRPKETQYNLPYCIQIKQNHNEVRDGWIDTVITRSKAKAVPLHAIKALGGREGIAPAHSRPRHYMEVSGQCHAPATL